MIVERQGACRHCGQISFIEVDAALDPYMVDMAVTRRCTCDAAEREKNVLHAQENLKMLTGGMSAEIGYEYAVDEETVAALNGIIQQVADGVFREVRVVEPGGDTIKIWSKIRGVGVQRTHKVDRKL